MTFRYFAYGSNLWVPQMRSRCPSAIPAGTSTLEGWNAVYDKPSSDGSAKLNIRPHSTARVPGVLYQIEEGERQALDAAEPGYTPMVVRVEGEPTLTYSYQGEPHPSAPYDWYVAMILLGASSHGIDRVHLEADPDPDPVAPGIRPVTVEDAEAIGEMLSEGLSTGTDRYYIHPGDYAWWIHHDDPRHPDHFSTWIQDGAGFVIIDSLTPHEINVFTRPGIDRTPLIDWAQRRVGGRGEVGWVSDDDRELVEALDSHGYRPVYANTCYRWDLTQQLPPPRVPPGWRLRHVSGEDEANPRRAASHAAFQSTMPGALHLQRYLDFMRSKVYVLDRDLVAVSPDGSIAAFMLWWGDRSGVAQIEPFGTHPEYQRQGIGRALMYHGLAEMRAEGMHTARVVTDEATFFYEGVGFDKAGPIWWWGRTT